LITTCYTMWNTRIVATVKRKINNPNTLFSFVCVVVVAVIGTT
jgi:hypothetical protein